MYRYCLLSSSSYTKSIIVFIGHNESSPFMVEVAQDNIQTVSIAKGIFQRYKNIVVGNIRCTCCSRVQCFYWYCREAFTSFNNKDGMASLCSADGYKVISKHSVCDPFLSGCEPYESSRAMLHLSMYQSQ